MQMESRRAGDNLAGLMIGPPLTWAAPGPWHRSQATPLYAKMGSR